MTDRIVSGDELEVGMRINPTSTRRSWRSFGRITAIPYPVTKTNAGVIDVERIASSGRRRTEYLGVRAADRFQVQDD